VKGRYQGQRNVGDSQHGTIDEVQRMDGGELLLGTNCDRRTRSSQRLRLGRTSNQSCVMTTGMPEESIQNEVDPYFVRRMKEDLKDFENKPLFLPRYEGKLPFWIVADLPTCLVSKTNESHLCIRLLIACNHKILMQSV